MMKSYCISLTLILVASWGVCVNGRKIPDFIHPCHRSDSHVTQCINKTIENLRHLLIKGIPELGTPALDPFEMDKVVVFDGKQLSDSRGHLTDVVAKGAGKFMVTNVNLDIGRKIYEYGVKIPALEIRGKHNFDLNLLGLQVKSVGNYYSKSTDIHGQAILHAALGNHNQLICKSLSLKLKIGDLDLNLESTTPKNPILDQAIKEIVNTNKPEFINMMTSVTERVISDILLSICNKIVKDFDYDDLFPI